MHFVQLTEPTCTDLSDLSDAGGIPILKAHREAVYQAAVRAQ